MLELDRVAAILKPTELMLDWINEHAESEEDVYTLDEVQFDSTVILLPAFQDEEEAEEFLLSVYDELFVRELMSWHDDPSLFPEDRTIEMFFEWFDIDFHSLVYDSSDLTPDDVFESNEEPRILQ